MSVFSEIISTLKDITSAAKDAAIFSGSQDAPLSQRAKTEGILEFPILISRNISIENANMVGKALERNFATFVQIVFSMNSVVRVADVKTPQEFVKLFHSNIAESVEDIEDTSIADRYTLVSDVAENVRIVSSIYNTSTPKIDHIMKESLVNLFESFNFGKVNDLYRPKMEGAYFFNNPERNTKYNSTLIEAKRPNNRRPNNESGTTNIGGGHGSLNTVDIKTDNVNVDKNRAVDVKSDKVNVSGDSVIAKGKDTTINPGQTRILNYNTMKKPGTPSDVDLHNKISLASSSDRMLRDNDVKKSNELVSTTLHVVIKQLSNDNQFAGMTDFIIGIKGKLHPIESQDMILQLRKAGERKGLLFNILRWSTGEISFVKDIILAIDDAKFDNADVSKSSSGNYNWFRRLKELKRRRGVLKALNSIGLTSQQVIPNSTLVVTEEEVEYLRLSHGVNLHDIRTVKTIMDDIFLFSFVIVDDSSQTVYFYFSGDVDFEVISFSGLERESADDQRKFKEMLKAINRA